MSPKNRNHYKKLINYFDNSHVAEAFRTLKTNIQFSSIHKDIKTLVITSSLPSEGKSFTACNLALTMARSGINVLLLDGDLRKPTLHNYFDLSSMRGLTNLLIEENKEYHDMSCKIEDNLTVMPSGPIPPNPTELLQTKRLRELMMQLKEHFDVVIIDSPPVLAVADPSILSVIADATLLIVEHGKCSRDSVVKAKEQLQMVKADIIGVVFNNVPPNGEVYQYSYYYGTESREKVKKTIINRWLNWLRRKKIVEKNKIGEPYKK